MSVVAAAAAAVAVPAAAHVAAPRRSAPQARARRGQGQAGACAHAASHLVSSPKLLCDALQGARHRRRYLALPLRPRRAHGRGGVVLDGTAGRTAAPAACPDAGDRRVEVGPRCVSRHAPLVVTIIVVVAPSAASAVAAVAAVTAAR